MDRGNAIYNSNNQTTWPCFEKNSEVVSLYESNSNFLGALK